MKEAGSRAIWIVDGHNAIFALPHLTALQLEGDRTGARKELERGLAQLLIREAARVIVVYDGNALPGNPDAIDGPALSICFSQPPEEADDRVVFLAKQALARGMDVTVVTNDRRSLASRLPGGARVLDVETFWARHVHPESAGSDSGRDVAPEARPPGDFSDIEQHFLSRAREIADGAARSRRSRERNAANRWRALHPRPGEISDEEGPDDEIEERGRKTRRPDSLAPAPMKSPVGGHPAHGAGAQRPGVGVQPPGAGAPMQRSTGGPQSPAERERKKARGRRKQERRLQQQKRAPRGGRARRNRR